MTFLATDEYKIARLKYDLPLADYPAVDLEIYSLVLSEMRKRKPRERR